MDGSNKLNRTSHINKKWVGLLYRLVRQWRKATYGMQSDLFKERSFNTFSCIVGCPHKAQTSCVRRIKLRNYSSCVQLVSPKTQKFCRTQLVASNFFRILFIGLAQTPAVPLFHLVQGILVIHF
jgi:hypothetical protein